MENFWVGFVKQAEDAKEKPDGHHVRRFFLGNPISSAIEAKKGDKTKAFGHAYGHQLVKAVKGIGVGAGGGALAGLAASAVSKGKIKPSHGAGIGAYGGAIVGGQVGKVIGNHDAEASKIHGEYSKHKK